LPQLLNPLLDDRAVCWLRRELRLRCHDCFSFRSGTDLVRADSATDFVEELVHRLADALEPIDLSQTELRIGDEPAVGRDLVLDEVIFRPGAPDPRPALP